MAEPLPIVLIPGLNCSARLYAEQIPALGRFGPVDIADCTRDSSMDAIAAGIVANAGINLGMLHLNPPRHVSVHRKSLGRRDGMLDRPRIARSRIQTSSLSG